MYLIGYPQSAYIHGKANGKTLCVDFIVGHEGCEECKFLVSISS